MTRPPAGDGQPTEAVAARCYRHPQRETFIRCTRCERPICPECMRPAAVGFHCPDDVSMARKTIRPQRTAVGARLRNSPAYVTYGLIVINIVIYFITVKQSGNNITSQPGVPLNGLFYKWQMFPMAVHDHGEYYRLITSAFLHVSLLHIGSNMITLYVVGPPLERLLGPLRFGIVYVLGALAGSAAVYVGTPALSSEVGASGAIFGLFAAALILHRRLPFDVTWLIGIVVLNFVLTFSVHNISKLGHIGGFVGGGLAALAIGGWPGTQRRPQRRHSTMSQAYGLGAVAMLIIAVVALRTATF